jgi:hypothetical protein
LILWAWPWTCPPTVSLTLEFWFLQQLLLPEQEQGPLRDGGYQRRALCPPPQSRLPGILRVLRKLGMITTQHEKMNHVDIPAVEPDSPATNARSLSSRSDTEGALCTSTSAMIQINK